MEPKQSTTEILKSKPVTISRTFDLPLQKVWRAWSETESLKKWWGPKDFTCPKCNIDFRVGGKILACMKDKEGKEFWSTGTYKEIVPNKKIVVTDSFSDEKGNYVSAKDMGMPGEWPRECLITIELEETGGKTAMKLKHEGIPSEAYDDCVRGWNESLDKLEKNLK